MLLALGFERRQLDASGGVGATGRATSVTARRATLAEIADVFDTVGGLSVVPTNSVYTAAAAGATVTITSARGPVVLTSDPPSLAATLSPVVAGTSVTVTGAGFALEPGWLLVSTAGEPSGMAPVWGRRAWIESDPLADADVAAYVVREPIVGVVVDGAPSIDVVGQRCHDRRRAAAAPDAVPCRVRRPHRPAGRLARGARREQDPGRRSTVGLRLGAVGLGFPTASIDSPPAGPGSAGGTSTTSAR